MIDFDLFIRKGLLDFKFGEHIDEVISSLVNCKVCPIDKDVGQYSVFYNGIELLFDDNKLYLIQYEVDRAINLVFNGHYIDANTTYTQFKNYLNEANVSFREESKDQQKILITDSNVCIYFDQDDEVFLTAMQDWFWFKIQPHLGLNGQRQIKHINNLSRHYRPTPQQAANFPRLIQDAGVDLKGSTMVIHEIFTDGTYATGTRIVQTIGF